MRHRGVRRRQAGSGRRHRGPAAAGVPRLRLRRDRAGDRRAASRGASAPASSPTSRRRSPTSPSPPSTTGIGHTRWATHGAPTDANAHPHLGATGRVALVHNGIIENFATLRAEVEASGDELLSETDTEIAAHLLEKALVARRRPDRRDAGALPAARGRVHARRGRRRRTRAASSRPAVTPRWWSASARARTSSAPTSRRSSSTPARRSSSARTRSSRSPATDVSVIGFDGTPVEGNRYHVDWDLSAAEKDGYDWFMRKEIFEQPRAIGDALLGRHDANGRLQLDEVRISDDELREVDKIIIIACGTAFYAGPGGQVRHRALDAHPVRGRAGPRVPLPRPDPDPVDARGRDQPVRRDRRHADGDPLRAPAALEGAGDLQHQRLDDPARVATRSSTPMPGPRSGSRRPRASSPR